MKKLILSLIMVCCFVLTKGQNQWVMMDTIVSILDGEQPFLAISPNNTPYMIYRNSSSKASVRKFNGAIWETVGIESFSAGGVNGPTIAFDNSGTLYAAYQDTGYGYRITVMKFDGTNWVNVGNGGFSDSCVSYTYLTMDSNGTPYVTFRDGAHNYGASVMKFDGSNWVFVGAPGFTHPVMDWGGASYLTIVFDSTGMPWIAYSDDSNGYRAVVQKFDGTNWQQVGSGYFGGWSSDCIKSFAFDSNNNPYIICTISGMAWVKKFDGTNWLPISSMGYSGSAEYSSILIDSHDTVYVSYRDNAYGHKATVRKYDGNSWVPIGGVGFSACTVSYTTLCMDSNGNLYIGYNDGTDYYGGWSAPHKRAGAMKYVNSTTVGVVSTSLNNDFTIYPNPANENIIVEVQDLKAQSLKVVNVLGKVVFSSSITKATTEIDVSTLAKGIYFVEVQTEKGIERKKFVKE